jgi:Sec-independent protein secretion pathway component TatC
MINKSIILALLFLPNLVFLLILLKSDFIYVFFKYRKLVILLIFIIGGIFSPPDIFSQLVIAFFLLILYELILGINLLNEIYLDKSKQN